MEKKSSNEKQTLHPAGLQKRGKGGGEEENVVEVLEPR